MAGDKNNEATFKLDFDTNAGEVSAEAAAELEQFRQKVNAGQDSIKQMGAALRSLRGSTDEVKSAKAALKAKIDATRDSVSAANLALLKQGTTFEKLTGQARKLADQQKKLEEKSKLEELKKATAKTEAMGNAMRTAGGPLDALKSRFESLSKVLGGEGGAMGAMTLAAAGLVAALAAIAVATVALGVSLIKFIVVGADAARSLNLMREAATGSAKNARNLGDQVDLLSGKVALSKERINELAVGLARTRLSGKAIVDTLNLTGQAAAAMGDDVGNALKEIVTRGQLVNRLQINPLELQGTGLKFEDIAGALATQMKVGVKDARAALFEGRVKLEDGAKALRTAVEKRFGEINARKLLSLDVQVAKFKERLGALTSGVNLEPLLQGFDELSKLFDSSTVTGATLKELVTIIGNGLGGAFKTALPIAKGFIKGLIIGGLDIAIAFLTVKKSVTSAFGGKDVLGNIDTMRIAIAAGKTVIYGFAGGLAVVAAAAAAVIIPIVGIVQAVQSVEWKKLGSSIIDGIVGGITSGAQHLFDAVTGLAKKVKGAFTGELKIASPSKDFFNFGRALPQGAAGGVEQDMGLLTGAVGTMAENAGTAGAGMATAYSSGGAPGGAAPVVINFNVNIEGGGSGAEIAKQLSEPSFLAQFTKVVQDVLVGAAIPTQGAVR